MTLPFVGHPIGKAKNKAKSGDDRELVNSAYRFLISDYFPFGLRAVIGLEHGATNNISEQMSGVAYWYGKNKASLILSDEFNVCNDSDRLKHNFSSSTVGTYYELSSRYEWGPDTDLNLKFSEEEFLTGSRKYYFAETDSVRASNGISSFTITLSPDNYGAMLRRKFDYAYPNQEALVFIRKPGEKNWIKVGSWYTSGSNTCVYSRPIGKSFTESEFSPTEHNIITSNRRWREEEFLISSLYTRGLNKLEIKLAFIPNSKELFPGQPYPMQSLWSESRYWIYSIVLPE